MREWKMEIKREYERERWERRERDHRTFHVHSLNELVGYLTVLRGQLGLIQREHLCGWMCTWERERGTEKREKGEGEQGERKRKQKKESKRDCTSIHNSMHEATHLLIEERFECLLRCAAVMMHADQRTHGNTVILNAAENKGEGGRASEWARAEIEWRGKSELHKNDKEKRCMLRKNYDRMASYLPWEKRRGWEKKQRTRREMRQTR
jgi:hypothetical protein